MKVKFLIAAALCIALPLFAACGKNDTTYTDFEDAAAVAEEQSAANEQAENTEQTETTEQTSGAEQSQTAEQSDDTEQDVEENEENAEDSDEVTVMYITINSNKLEVTLAENSSVSALIEILKRGDITYVADDYGNFEKVGDIGHTLPQNNERITTEAGDVILYQGDNICLYYGVNTWSFTRIGKINGYSAEQLETLLCAGQGEIEVTISLN